MNAPEDGEDDDAAQRACLAADIAAMFSVSVMYNTERRSNSNICQYKVSGKELGYKQCLSRLLREYTFNWSEEVMNSR